MGLWSSLYFSVDASCQYCIFIFFQLDVTFGMRPWWQMPVDVLEGQIIAVQEEPNSRLEILSV